MGSPDTKRKASWPTTITRKRSISALELAGDILDQEADLDPQVGTGDNFETVTLDAGTWDRFVGRARRAVGGLKAVELSRPPFKIDPPDYADALEAFLAGGVRTSFETEAFEAGWNGGRKRTTSEREGSAAALVRELSEGLGVLPKDLVAEVRRMHGEIGRARMKKERRR